MSASFIEFQFTSDERFEMLINIFAALDQAKKSDNFHDDDYWLSFFDESAKSYFWWPTDKEIKDWKQHWDATPVSRRRTDASLRRPWLFGSMIDAIRNGEYELVSCHRTTENIGRLEFLPFADPFGGTESIKALIESLGFRVIKESEI